MNVSLDDQQLLNDAAHALSTQDARATPAAAAVEGWWSTTNAMTMCSIILLFGVVVLVLCAWLLRSGKLASEVLRVFGTILVITMATFLVVAGYNDQQIAAPLGLLGTIAGYLLGRETDRDGTRARSGAEP